MPLSVKWLTNENILCSTGNSTQCSDLNGKKKKKIYIYIYTHTYIYTRIVDSLCYTAKTNTKL